MHPTSYMPFCMLNTYLPPPAYMKPIIVVYTMLGDAKFMIHIEDANQVP